MIRVVIVDDHPVVREGVAAVLGAEADVEIASAVGSAEELLSSLERDRPDVVLLDLALPGMGGLEAISRLRHGPRPVPVVIFSALDDPDAMVDAVRSGARGYVVKGAPGAEIVAAIREVGGGGSYFRGASADAIADAVRRPRGSDGLTPREREVIRLVGEGLSNKQIAQRLGIAERTAKFHVRQIMEKLGAENRAQAVALATRRRMF